MKLKRIATFLIMVACTLLVQNSTFAQGPAAPSAEHKQLKADAGTWKAVMKIWMPGSDQPMEAVGTEVNEMFGEFWMISKFQADMGGQPFEGGAALGFDPVKKKYIGTWFDTMNPQMSHMEGTYDKESKTMTMTTTGYGMDGKPTKGKNVTVTKDDGSRVFTMYGPTPGSDKLAKMMEITYTKK